jgi:hypothetical protein
MKLVGMLDAFDQSVVHATREKTDYTEFLDTLIGQTDVGTTVLAQA